VSHLIGNRASFLCTKAPMPRVISEWHPISGRFLPPSPPPAAAPNINESKPGGPALATRARTALGPIRQLSCYFIRSSVSITDRHFLDNRWLWPRKAGAAINEYTALATTKSGQTASRGTNRCAMHCGDDRPPILAPRARPVSEGVVGSSGRLRPHHVFTYK
jgi:hypothetical protein